MHAALSFKLFVSKKKTVVFSLSLLYVLEPVAHKGGQRTTYIKYEQKSK